METPATATKPAPYQEDRQQEKPRYCLQQLANPHYAKLNLRVATVPEMTVCGGGLTRDCAEGFGSFTGWCPWRRQRVVKSFPIIPVGCPVETGTTKRPACRNWGFPLNLRRPPPPAMRMGTRRATWWWSELKQALEKVNCRLRIFKMIICASWDKLIEINTCCQKFLLCHG